jgi:hypothetical protein
MSVRFLAETFGLMALSAAMLLAVIVGVRQFADDRLQYFLLGYYVAIHNDLVRRIWKRLRIEKAAE